MRAEVIPKPDLPGHAVLRIHDLNASPDGLTISIERRQGPEKYLSDGGWQHSESWLAPERIQSFDGGIDFHVGPIVCDMVAGLPVRLSIRECGVGNIGATVVAWPTMQTSGANDSERTAAPADGIERSREPDEIRITSLRLRIHRAPLIETPPPPLLLVGGPVSIGRRDDNGWVLPDSTASVSRKHATVDERNGVWRVIDESANGMLHNGQIVGRGNARPISAGDIIKIGDYEILVEPAPDAGGGARPAMGPAPQPLANPYGIGDLGNAGFGAPPPPPSGPSPFDPPPPERLAEAPRAVDLFGDFGTHHVAPGVGVRGGADAPPVAAFGDVDAPIDLGPGPSPFGGSAPSNSPFGSPAGGQGSPFGGPAVGSASPFGGHAASGADDWGSAAPHPAPNAGALVNDPFSSTGGGSVFGDQFGSADAIRNPLAGGGAPPADGGPKPVDPFNASGAPSVFGAEGSPFGGGADPVGYGRDQAPSPLGFDAVPLPEIGGPSGGAPALPSDWSATAASRPAPPPPDLDPIEQALAGLKTADRPNPGPSVQSPAPTAPAAAPSAAFQPHPASPQRPPPTAPQPAPWLPPLYEPARETEPSRASIVGNNAPSTVDATQFMQCSVFAPPTTVVGRATLIQVFVHQLAQSTEVAALAREHDEAARERGRRILSIENLIVGTKIQVQVVLAGFQIEPPLGEIVWTGRPEAAQVVITAGPGTAVGGHIGRANLLIAGIPIGEVWFRLDVVMHEVASDRPERMSTTSRFYRRVFASYASADRSEVLKRVQGLRAGGIDFFLDVFSLTPGQRWEPELYSQIDSADAVFLFWSRAARESQWVRKEIRYALECQGRRSATPDGEAQPAIVAVPIEGPPPVRPPPELAHLHFNDALLYLIPGRKPPVWRRAMDVLTIGRRS